jgi:uncharacterized delta-60 repeat protein
MSAFARRFGRHGSVVRWCSLAVVTLAIAGPFCRAALPTILSIDPSYDVSIDGGAIAAMARTADGKVVIAGGFTTVNGMPRRAIVRLNDDGSLDPTFAAAVDNGDVAATALQGDGRILIAGSFSSVGGVTRRGLARLNADGSVDTTFDAGAASNGARILRIVPLPDGRTMVGGAFSSFGTATRWKIARLFANGAVDPSFDPFVAAPRDAIFFLTDIAVQPDGRVYYANDGTFSSGGIASPIFGRLLANGDVDPAFSRGLNTHLGYGVKTILLRPDGGLLIGGTFGDYNHTGASRIARLQEDGTVVPGFAQTLTSTDPVTRLIMGDDGLVYVFRRSRVTGREIEAAAALTRMKPDGELDGTFFVAFSATHADFPAVQLLDHGNFLITGAVFTENGVVRSGLMRTRTRTDASIVSQPASSSVVAGASLTLSVRAVGAQSPTYQWFKDGAAIEGAVRSTYTIADAQAPAAGGYFVRITHENGTIDSAVAIVFVTDTAPAFTSSSAAPGSLGSVMRPGTRFALTAPKLASGSAPVSYQWFKNGAGLSGETGPALFRAAWSVADSGSYQVVVSNAFGSSMSQAVYQAVADTPDWKWVSPAPEGNPLTSISFVHETFFATGQRGTILRSTDGIGWTSHRLRSSTTVGPVAFGADEFVALTSYGGVLTSSDGTAWTAQETGLTDGRSLTQIAFANGRFVAVGTVGTVVSSTDGIAWTQARVGTRDTLNGVAYGGGRWITVSSSGQVYSSLDGVVWGTSAMLPEGTVSLAFGAGLFAANSAATPGVIYTSPDGAIWTQRFCTLSVSAGIAGLRYTEHGFVGLLGSTAGSYVFSADGITWVERDLASLASLPTALTYGKGLFVLTAGPPDLLLVSPSGGSWFRTNSGEGRTFRAVTANDRLAVAVGLPQGLIGFPSGLVYASNDGVNWFMQSAPTTAALYDVACGATASEVFVAVGTGGTILTSASSEGWTLRGSGLTFRTLQGVKYVGNCFLAVGDGGTVLVSVDGKEWMISVTPVTTQALVRCAHGAGLYVVVGTGGTVLTTADPFSAVWTARSSGTLATLIDVTYANGCFVAVASTGEIIRSTDGITWTRSSSPAAALSGVTWANGSFLALGAASSYFVSADGISWVAAQQGSALSLYDAVEFKSRVIGVGSTGSILARDIPITTADKLPVRVTGPVNAPRVGESLELAMANSGIPAMAQGWEKDGSPLAGATETTLRLAALQPGDAGLYDAFITSAGGCTTSAPAIVGVTTSVKAIGAGSEVGRDIVHPNGNIFDQVLLTGAAATITADDQQVTRTSFVDLNDDIVQVEFSGPGSLSLVLDQAGAPLPPAKYNQPGVEYVKGHAGIVITGATENTHLSIFSIGRANAVNAQLFRDDVDYDGVADLAYVAIQSANGKFGGMRLGNADFFATRGFTGVFAPGVEFTDVVAIGEIDARDAAVPVLILGSAAEVKIAGGNLQQSNSRSVQLAGVSRLRFVAGTKSSGAELPAQPNRACLEHDGEDVTAQVVLVP